jgi:hypothetical protein
LSCASNEASTEKLKTMNKQEIKLQIEKLAKEENISFLQACSAMQSAAALMNNESIIDLIYQLKTESAEYKKLFN